MAEEHNRSDMQSDGFDDIYNGIKDDEDYVAFLYEKINEVENELASDQEALAELCSENHHLEGVLEVKKKLVSDAETEKQQTEESIRALRNEIRNIKAELNKQRSIRNSNQTKYEIAVGEMSASCLARRKSYDELELEVAVRNLEQTNTAMKEENDALNEEIQRVKAQYEKVKKSYLELDETCLKNVQIVTEEYVKETIQLSLENQRMFTKLEDIERYMKDSTS